MIKNNIADSDHLKLTVTRVINAPCALVFKAWTDPVHLARWFGPREVECRGVEADVRVGGSLRVHMVSPKGDHIGLGKFTEIVPDTRVQFTWEWHTYAMPGSRVTVDLEDLGATTRLTLTHEGLPDQEDVTEHTHGWTSLVEKFGAWMVQNQDSLR